MSAPTDMTADWPYFPATAQRLGWQLLRARGRRLLRVPTWHPLHGVGRTKLRFEKRPGLPTATFEQGDERPVGILCGAGLLDALAGEAQPTVALLAGETDTLAWTWACAREDIAVPGVSLATGEASPLPEPIAQLFWSCDVRIFYDADAVGRAEGFVRAGELLDAGAASATSIHVPAPHKDVCDYVRAGGRVAALLRAAEEQWDDPFERPIAVPRSVRAATRATRGTESDGNAPPHAYGRAVLERECDRVRSVPDGAGRNPELCRAAFRIGQLTPSGGVSVAAADEALLDAARVAGMPERKSHDTIRRALAAGARAPRDVPIARRPR